MSPTFRIAILGIGGVGGFMGGKLAALELANVIETIFISRGENEKALRDNGLSLVTSQGTINVRPTLVTSRPNEIGAVDLVICCVKTYDLATAVQGMSACVGPKTVVLPLLNGVDASQRISQMLPNAEIWEGCIYLLSRLTSPGIVTQIGKVNRLSIGSNHAKKVDLERVCGIFRKAGIDAVVTDNSSLSLWEKFVFLSPIATAASYLDKTIGQVLESGPDRQLLLALMSEACAVARAMKVDLPPTIINDTLAKLAKVPHEAVPSMLADFRARRRTERDTLTVYVASQGSKLGVPTPRYENLAQELARMEVQGRTPQLRP